MSTPTKPVVVLAHGAWHQPLHYLPLIQRLAQDGFTVAAPQHPTCGWHSSIKEKTFQDDVQNIQDTMDPYLEAGREIILVGHSYGSLPAVDCVPGNTVEERKARGLQGGVRALLHIASTLPLQAGLDIMGQIKLVPGGAEKYDPPPTWWGVVDGLSVCFEDAPKHLYSDVDPNLASLAGAALVKHSASVFAKSMEHSVADAKVPHTYVICENDEAFDTAIQEGMASMSGAKVVRMQCGHSPFLKEKETGELVEIINGL